MRKLKETEEQRKGRKKIGVKWNKNEGEKKKKRKEKKTEKNRNRVWKKERGIE